jgi:prephenate dehydrogenase
MSDVRIGIIGGTGGIGRRFADFFREEGYQVDVSGRTSGMTIPQTAATCQVVIVAVPIDTTGDVIRQVGPYMGREQLLADFTSLKEEPLTEMLGSSASEVVGCHPLFGPDVTSLADQNVAICPGRGENWLNWFVNFLEKKGARVVITTPRHHDEMMSQIQGLTHINTIAMALVLKELGADPAELSQFSTPIFRTKKALMEKIFGKNHSLYAEMIMRNRNSSQVVDVYAQVLAELKRMVAAGDTAALKKRIEAVSIDKQK